MLIWTTCIGILCVSRCSCVSEVIAEATEVIGVIRLGLSLVQYMSTVFEEVCGEGCSVSFQNLNDPDRELLQQTMKITQQMNDIEESIASVQSSVYALHRTLPTYVRYEIKFDRLEQVISHIWYHYSLLQFYQQNIDKVERHTLEDFAMTITSHRAGSVRSNLYILHDLIAPKHLSINKGILSTLATQVKVE